MGAPVLLVDNLFSSSQYPLHAMVADEEASGYEFRKARNGRRSRADYYTASTANAQRTLDLSCNRVRAADMLVLDRGHNLGGATLTLQGSMVSPSTSLTTIWSGTVPTVTSPGRIDEPNGVVTEEGAFLVRFTPQAYRYWRLTVPALGSGIRPQIVGLWLGLSWSPDYFTRPWAEDMAEVIVQEQSSDIGWVGQTAPQPRRSGTLGFQLRDDWSYELARYHIQGQWIGRRRPMWIVMDAEQADRAVLAMADLGVTGFRFDDAAWRNAQIGWREHEPLSIT